ncbi:hypothetical protein EVAR_52612_1 [Eumeta japonica]|uniref:Uncharacterized protein n=1 Tax=Eumeta variegata TaxID=151549 RepID=A0A4C1YPJ1_EUMVA|nr:hypothetical protein EVAR_52612_1 [Eumeta japonica]
MWPQAELRRENETRAWPYFFFPATEDELFRLFATLFPRRALGAAPHHGVRNSGEIAIAGAHAHRDPLSADVFDDEILVVRDSVPVSEDVVRILAFARDFTCSVI